MNMISNYNQLNHVNEDDCDGEDDVHLITDIDDLPYVILEYILSHLSPYSDLLSCKLTCKAWRLAVISTICKLKRDFINCLSTSDIEWDHYSPSSLGPSISPRYSHSACYLGDSVYIFGGCTIANTTFNDLWSFHLTTRSWVRPIATGTFPTPKACASFVKYDSSLILFGGWSHSSPYPIHQEWRIFNHVHEFDTRNNRWNLLTIKSFSPSIAGHSACVVNDEMIVFGGLTSHPDNPLPLISSNDVWVLDLKSLVWRNQATSENKPLPRYGHSSLVLDSNHILIMGGIGGPNMQFSDVWLLKINNDVAKDDEPSVWSWHHVQVNGENNESMPQISFHPACKIGDLVVLLSGVQKSRNVQCKDGQILRKPSVRNEYKSNSEENSKTSSNPKLMPQSDRCSSSSSSTCSKQHTPLSLLSLKLDESKGNQKGSHSSRRNQNRQRQLEGLDRQEQRLKQLKCQNAFSPMPIRSATVKSINSGIANNPMQLCVLDIKGVIDTHTVAWMTHNTMHQEAPQEIILYSLVAGRAEIIMFGGIQKDINMKQPNAQQNQDNVPDNIPDIVSNQLHIISAKQLII